MKGVKDIKESRESFIGGGFSRAVLLIVEYEPRASKKLMVQDYSW
jgi:hypothetical protein